MEENDTVYSAQESQKAWRRRTLGALGAFLRRQYMHVAPVASQIEQGVAEEGVSPDVQQTVLRNLHL